MNRRIALARIGVWAAVAAGPLALAVACAMPRTTAAAAQPKPSLPSAVRSADPAGIAALFVDLWLRSDTARQDAPVAQAVRALGPNVDLPTRPGDGTTPAPVRTVAVRSAQTAGGGWSVVVAAQFTVSDSLTGSGTTPSGTGAVVRYYAVPVVAADSVSGAGAFTVTSAPAEVAGPTAASVPASVFANPVPVTSPLASSAGEFLSAYLTGVGEVDRYLSPGTQLTAVRGTGYRSVVVDQAAADTEGADAAKAPGDGTRVRVLVHVAAQDGAGGQWPLVYRLTMTARDGRWEVTALEAGAPAPDTAAKASPAGAATAGGAGR